MTGGGLTLSGRSVGCSALVREGGGASDEIR